VAIVAMAMAIRQQARTKAEIDADNRTRLQRTIREIDQLYSAYLERIGRKRKGRGAVYARYSTRFQDSIADQVRAILDFAAEQGMFVLREMIFFDMAVRGFKDRRDGLDELRAVLKKGRVDTLLLFKTNRIFRKRYHTLKFVDQVHTAWRIRCVF